MSDLKGSFYGKGKYLGLSVESRKGKIKRIAKYWLARIFKTRGRYYLCKWYIPHHIWEVINE